MVHHISSTEYLNYEDGKFSKSRNLGVFGDAPSKLSFSSSVWRYYLLGIRPEAGDSNFSWKDFITKNNSELLSNLGNFCNRVLKFLGSKYDSLVPALGKNALESTEERQLLTDVDALVAQYNNEMRELKLKAALRTLMEISQRGNQYITVRKLDNSLFTDYKEQCDTTLVVCINLIALLSSLMFPFMPETTDQLNKILNAPLFSLENFNNGFAPNLFGNGHGINKPAHLFTRIDDSLEAVYRKQFGGS